MVNLDVKESNQFPKKDQPEIIQDEDPESED